MKPHISLQIILAVSLVVYQPLFGQSDDYLLIQSDFLFFEPNVVIDVGKGCFNCPTEHYVTGVRIDSSNIQPSLVTHYFNHEIVDDESECLRIGPSLLGDSMIEYNNGISTCFTIGGNEITINRWLKTDESSVVYSFENGDYFKATVISNEPEQLFNVLDTVKTFVLQLYSSENNTIEHSVNNQTIKISKNFGLTHFIGFRDFPEYTPELVAYKLISNDFIQANKFMLTRGDIYDFTVGDKFHYKNMDHRLGPDGYENVEKEVVDKEMSITKDSVIYKISERRWGWRTNTENSKKDGGGYYQIDTVYSVAYSNLGEHLLPGQMPFEAIYENEFSVVNSLMYNKQYDRERIIIRKYGQSLSVDGDCLTPPFDSYDGTIIYYIEGCGHLYNRIISEVIDECYPCEHLVYYKKGEDVWGQPLHFPKDKKISHRLSIYPNPAKDEIEIQSANELSQIRIFNIYGKEVSILFDLNVFSIVIDISNFNSGLYLLSVQIKNGISTVEKLIIE